MQGGTAQRIERIRRSLSLVTPIVTLSVGVVLPVLLSTATGIVAIVIGESSVTLVLGILVVCFMAAAIGGAVILYVLLGRRVRVARLQSDLLANVTHELRTPLAAVRVYAETLHSGLLRSDPVRAEECLKTIIRETEWLDAMIDRVLSWRAAARDRGSYRLEEGLVCPVVEEAVARFQRMVRPDEVELSFSCASPHPIPRDREALQQAVLNLLVNAYKYSRGPRRIGVEVGEREGNVVIAVSDNGIGIAAREIPRLFEPFYRSGSAAAHGSGAGLGLAIVHHVVMVHGGVITVESKEGEGSRFSLHLPLAPEGTRA